MVVISGNRTYFLTCFFHSCNSHVILCCLLAPTSENMTDGGPVNGWQQFFIISLLVSDCHINVENPTKHLCRFWESKVGKKKKGFFGVYKLTNHTKNCDLQSISDMLHICINDAQICALISRVEILVFVIVIVNTVWGICLCGPIHASSRCVNLSNWVWLLIRFTLSLDT